MTREIKFRAWNPDPKHPYPMVQNPLHRCDAGDVLEKKSIYKDWVLMQYTGLKDRNNKEIYESDILQNEDGVGFSVVEWNVCGFNRRWMPIGVTSPLSLNPEQWEIVGNLYENPEMIEKIKNSVIL